MQVKNILNNYSYNQKINIPIDINKTIPIDTNCYKNKYDNDFLYEQLQELCCPTYKAWYCREFYRLGRDKVLQLASIAKADGNEPAKYFSRLIKTTI